MYHANLGDICLVDTPGLSEDTLETDKAYLRLLQEYASKTPIDVILYVTKLDENRFRPDEKRTLKLLTDYLGPSIWQKAWIVFTFAASVPTDQLQLTTRIRYEAITAFLHDLTVGSTTSFSNFLKIIQIDNIVFNWTDKAVPISSILTATLP